MRKNFFKTTYFVFFILNFLLYSKKLNHTGINASLNDSHYVSSLAFYSYYKVIFKDKILQKHFLNDNPKLLTEINKYLLRENDIVKSTCLLIILIRKTKVFLHM